MLPTANASLLAWMHEDYDRTLVLKALDGTAFLDKWRTAKQIRQLQPLIDEKKLSSILREMHKRALISSKFLYKGKSRTVYMKGSSHVFMDKTKGWRQTNLGAGIMHSMGVK